MSSTAATNENSVQFSLAELRELHADRLATEKQAEEQRHLAAERERMEAERRRAAEARELDERRIAAEHERQRLILTAQHELELAKERARLDAQARVQEQKLALELKQVDAEILQAQAVMPKKRAWVPLMVVAVLLLGVQGLLFWQLNQTAERVARGERSAWAMEQNTRTTQAALGKLEAAIVAAKETARRADERAGELEAALAAAGKKDKPAATSTVTVRDRNPGRDRNRDPDRGPGHTPVDVSDCAKQPLGCL